MTQGLVELCSLLVEDLYGGLAAAIYKTLAQNTRVTLSILEQRSNLLRKHVRHGLVVLIQQHLVLVSTAENETTVTYEVDSEGAYALLRHGRLVDIVENRYGCGYARIIQDLLFYGHTRVCDLEKNYDYSGKKAGWSPGDEGDLMSAADVSQAPPSSHGGEDDIHTPEELHSAIQSLMHAGFIIRVTPNSYRSATDRHNDVDDAVVALYFEGTKTTGPKAQLEYSQRMLDMKRKRRTDDEAVVDEIYETKADSGRPTKRARTNRPMANGANGQAADAKVKFKGDLVIRANVEKCGVVMRSLQIEQYAARFCDPTTARVYAALLRLSEVPYLRCRDDWLGAEVDPPINTSTVVQDLLEVTDPGLDLKSCIYRDAEEDGDDDQDDDDDTYDTGSSTRDKNRRLRLVDQHLRMLSEHSKQFLQRVGSRGMSEWRVDFRALTTVLQTAQVENIISAKYGYLATRIVNLLKAKKERLDEKLIANIALVPRKDIRNTLSPMQEAGMIDIQEIPRDTARQPLRATYLWFFNQERIIRLLLSQTYKSQSRLLQRMSHQRSTFKEVLEKADREDVRKDLVKYLSSVELKQLADWREQEEKFLTQLMRQDDLVALFRDF